MRDLATALALDRRVPDNVAELRDFHARSVQELFEAFVGDRTTRLPSSGGKAR